MGPVSRAAAQLPFPTLESLFRAAEPPQPPPVGPGSQVYGHAGVQMTLHEAGRHAYWVYAPAQPTPVTAPVFVYLHGYGASSPYLYEGLLTHLARKGYLVVFPTYGDPLFDLPWFEDHAIDVTTQAFEMLRSWDGPRPGDQVALGGHSLGAVLALRVATRARQAGLPQPQLLVLHEPAGVAILDLPVGPFDLVRIPATTRLLVIQADTTLFKSNSFAMGAFKNTVLIPRAQKNLLRVRSDGYAYPVLLSDHQGVQSSFGRPFDAIDVWGYLRPTEAALDEVLRGRSLLPIFCSRRGELCDPVRFAGRWSDGTPVRSIQNAGDLGL